jgi:hypothetical protein
MTQPFTTDLHPDGVAEVVINQPPVNALNAAGWHALAQNIQTLGQQPDVRVIVIRAEGRGFCAGVDIKELNEKPDLIVSVNAGTYAAFLKDELIVAADKNARSQAINTGVISAVAGFDIFEYPAIISTNTLIGFAGLKDSAVLAMRAPSNPQDISDAPYAGKLTYVTGPESGITVMVNEWIDQSTLAVNVRLIWLYGVAVGNATNGQRMVSAAT